MGVLNKIPRQLGIPQRRPKFKLILIIYFNLDHRPRGFPAMAEPNK
jgi:hypothetical protein